MGPPRIVKGGGRDAVKNQRDAERAQLKEMIQAGRRAKAAEAPIVVECLEVDGNDERKAPRSSAWAATLGKSTVTIEEDANIEEIDVDEVIELEDSENGSECMEEDLETGDMVADLDADMNADATKVDDGDSFEAGDAVIGLTPDQVA